MGRPGQFPPQGGGRSLGPMCGACRDQTDRPGNEIVVVVVVVLFVLEHVRTFYMFSKMFEHVRFV